jgi:hypothetical protein
MKYPQGVYVDGLHCYLRPKVSLSNASRVRARVDDHPDIGEQELVDGRLLELGVIFLGTMPDRIKVEEGRLGLHERARSMVSVRATRTTASIYDLFSLE